MDEKVNTGGTFLKMHFHGISEAAAPDVTLQCDWPFRRFVRIHNFTTDLTFWSMATPHRPDVICREQKSHGEPNLKLSKGLACTCCMNLTVLCSICAQQEQIAPHICTGIIVLFMYHRTSSKNVVIINSKKRLRKYC